MFLNMDYFEYGVLSVVLIVTLYVYGIRTYSHFEGKGVKYIRPPLPFLGSTVSIMFQREHLNELVTRFYNVFPDQKYIGLFELQRPLILVRDVNVIKQFAIKDFDHFLNHRSVVRSDLDSLFGNGLFSLEGNKWRDMRATLSPAFTSAKMKNMFELVEECAKDVVDFYSNKVKDLGKDVVEIEAKSEFSKFTTDVIASAAYGLKINSFADENNDFYRSGKYVTSFRGIQLVKFFGYAIVPGLMRLLKIQFLDQKIGNFFKDVVSNTMKHRSENNIHRNDMINILMEAKKGTLTHEKESEDKSDTGFATVQESAMGRREVKQAWTDDELIAQAFTFFLGSFETVTTFLTFFFYEMVKNPEIQTNLQQEIDDFRSESNDAFVYNDLQKLKYLDMCISENLRMWPPGSLTDRVCNKSYTLPPASDSSDQPYQVNVGEAIWIPINALHHDPKYFPDPEKFIPERFSDGNKSKIEPLAYIPFGVGPRNCIGSRFALMEAKIIIYHMLSKFDFVTTAKTEIPVKLTNAAFSIAPKNGMNLGIRLRNNVAL